MAKVDKLSGSRARIEIPVTPEQFEHGLDHAFEQIKDDVEIKGFRKGKVTRKVYEQQKGVESLYEEALNHVLQETYYEAVNEAKIDVVAQPKIDLDINKVKRGEAFTYTATVAIKPDVKLGQYTGFTYEQAPVEVSDEDVDKKINELRQQNAELIIKEDGPLEKSDTAIFDFEGFIDGETFEGGKAENHQLEIGSGRFIPGFEDQMLGMKPGEDKEVNVSFPEDYQAEHLKGKDAVFKTKLHEIKIKEVPELTDDFVKDLDKENVGTVAELKQNTKDTLIKDRTEQSKNKAIDFAVDQAAQNAEFEIPEDMIVQEKNRQIDNVKSQAQQYGMDLETYLKLSGLEQAQFEENIRKQAEKSIRYNLTLEAIAEKEGIEAGKEEVEKKYEELGKQHNMDKEQIVAQVNENAMKQEVIMRKTIDFLVENLKEKE